MDIIKEYLIECLVGLGLILFGLKDNRTKAEKKNDKIKRQEKKVATDLTKAEKSMQKLEEMKKES